MGNLVSIIDGSALTSSLLIAEGVGYDHSTVIRLVRDNREDLEEFGPLGFEIHVVNRPQGGGSKKEYALLNEDQATLLITYMRNNDVVRAFKKTLVKAFRDLRLGAQNVDVLSAPVQLLQDMVNRIATTEKQRDEAIRTKAQINNKKTATAMATAMHQKKRADKLEQELGKHVSWKCAKAIDWAAVVFAPSQAMWSQFGKYLKRLSDEMGINCEEVEDTRHGRVKAYHIDVITEAYKRLKEDESILHKYRAIKTGAA